MADEQQELDLVNRLRKRAEIRRQIGHHHTRIDAEVVGVPCLGLNKMGRPGNLMAIEMEERGRAWKVLSEWPKPEAGGQGRTEQ